MASCRRRRGPATWTALGIGGSHPCSSARACAAAGNPAAPGLPSAILRAISAANRIAGLPYRFGGGHRLRGHRLRLLGLDQLRLRRAGLLSTTVDSSQLVSYGPPGPGRWITIFANGGHTFMYVAGLRFDTAGRS